MTRNFGRGGSNLLGLGLALLMGSIACSAAWADTCLTNEGDPGLKWHRPYKYNKTWQIPNALPDGGQFHDETAASVATAFQGAINIWTGCGNVPKDGASQVAAPADSFQMVWVDRSLLPGLTGHTDTGAMVSDDGTYMQVRTAHMSISKNLYIGGRTIYWTACTDCSYDPTSGNLDLQSTFAHELGHQLGFNDSDVDGYVMGPAGWANTCNELAVCETESANDLYGCKPASALFVHYGMFSDTAYCETFSELGTDSVALYGFSTPSAYPSAGVKLREFVASGGTARLHRYEATGVGGYAGYVWRESGSTTPAMATGPFGAGTRPDDYYTRYEQGEDIDSVSVTAHSSAADGLIGGSGTPAEGECADIVVYSFADTLADPIYQQIVRDAPSARVRKVLAGSTAFYGSDHSAQACKDSIAAVVSANAAWNSFCTAGGCHHYPVTPGPEVYIVGDSWPALLQRPSPWGTYSGPVGVGTMETANYELACLGHCHSDALIYDLDGDGVPDGPISRIPAWSATEARNAAAAAEDVNRGRNAETGWHVALLQGKMYGDPDSASALLAAVKQQYRNINYTAYPILDEALYPPVGFGTNCWDAPLNAFSAQASSGLREIFGYGGMTYGANLPGYFVMGAGLEGSRLSAKTRLVSWTPACLMHATWMSQIDASGNAVRPLMCGDTTKTMIAASVGQMDIGWFQYHYRMGQLLANARETAGAGGGRKSVARVAYDAVMAAIAEGRDLAQHALALSTWGSYTLVGTGTASSGGGCPFVDELTPQGWIPANSILARSADGSYVRDALRLRLAPNPIQGRYALRIRENEQEQTTLDRVGLLCVDHDSTLRALPSGDGYQLGHVTAATTVLDQAGRSRGTEIAGGGVAGMATVPGDTLYVSFGSNALSGPLHTNATGYSVQTSGSGFDLESSSKELPPDGLSRIAGHSSTENLDSRVLTQTGILVQAPDGAGGWRTVHHEYPREQFAESVIDSIGAGPVRLIPLAAHRVRLLGRVDRVPLDSLNAHLLVPVRANHSRLGDVQTAVATAGGATTTLVPGDTLNLAFTAPSLPTGKVRDFFVVTRGVYTTIGTQGAGGSVQAVASYKFSLGPARPNPSIGRVTFGYSLGQPSNAVLSLYSVSGRLIRTVVNGAQAAGPHEVVWDGTDDHGQRVHAGVFFYRLRAGSWSSEKKLVVIQP